VRIVVFNVLYYGRGSCAHIAAGVRMFVRDAPGVGRSYVKPEVQEKYTAQLLTAQPVWPRVAARLRRVFANSNTLPQGAAMAPAKTPGTSPRG
jgi:hypothetical protein